MLSIAIAASAAFSEISSGEAAPIARHLTAKRCLHATNGFLSPMMMTWVSWFGGLQSSAQTSIGVVGAVQGMLRNSGKRTSSAAPLGTAPTGAPLQGMPQ
eukprot:5392864-Amphidinium_carterae.2